MKLKDKMRNHKNIFSILVMVTLLVFSSEISAQEKEDKTLQKEQKQLLRETKQLNSEASVALAEDKFVEGEADYRKAIAINPKSETAKYNLGNAYYNKAKNDEAMSRFQQAADVATSKNDKHSAYHNLGNTYMNAKQYQDAVDAYKNALRNNPNDDETRYNLALAKDLLEKNPPKGGEGDNKDQDKNQDKNDQNEDNQDKKDEEGKDKEGSEGDEEEDKDKGDEQNDEKKGENEEDKGKPDQPNEGEQDKADKKQPQPQPGQMSPQQIKNLLEAMNNEEQKVQEKINAKKQKGAKVKSEKDW
ncbi:tetratricopeptide repeat protein [Marinirhabdus gelatinilytica]|uniref:Tetratricopeptide repeat protein n=1 Tax=Marinirhabdus gelatinilytica TaxID=1703343 RepID=A0A370QJV1_9FLAO|nr:tetratricopeptide repeat protein [Marinirhabdus gelatinilytica]RDK88634.1 tetratricopeptide repeat protein [Marinirhabdus gelatinilytica]